MLDLDAVNSRYQSMPVIERVAVVAQFLGTLTVEVPQQYTSAEVLSAIAMNLSSGNEGAATRTLAMVGEAGHG
jgi:hypothetical protein